MALGLALHPADNVHGLQLLAADQLMAVCLSLPLTHMFSCMHDLVDPDPEAEEFERARLRKTNVIASFREASNACAY